MDSAHYSGPNDKIPPAPGTNQIAGCVEFRPLTSRKKDKYKILHWDIAEISQEQSVIFDDYRLHYFWTILYMWEQKIITPFRDCMLSSYIWTACRKPEDMIGHRSYRHKLRSCEIKHLLKFCDDQSYIRIVFLWSSNTLSFIYSFALFIIYGYITNSRCDQLSVGLKSQLVAHCTGIAVIMSLNPVHA